MNSLARDQNKVGGVIVGAGRLRVDLGFVCGRFGHCGVKRAEWRRETDESEFSIQHNFASLLVQE